MKSLLLILLSIPIIGFISCQNDSTADDLQAKTDDIKQNGLETNTPIVKDEQTRLEERFPPSTNAIAIEKRVYFHAKPDETTILKSFIVSGQNCTVEKVENGFGYVSFDYKGKTTKGWLNLNYIDPINRETGEEDIVSKCTILNTWLKDAIGYNAGIDTNAFKKSNINSVQNYKNLISKSFKEKIVFRVNDIKPKIEVSNKSITLYFTDEDYNYEKFLIFEDKLIYSFGAGVGDGGLCVIYNLLTQQEKELEFRIQSVQNNIATISQDGYDADGHWWREGQFNLSTSSITWGSKEH